MQQSTEADTPQSRRPEQTPVVLLHPGGVLASFWQPLAADLHHRYPLLMPELLPLSGSATDWNSWTHQVATQLQAHSSAPAHLIGVSLGANVALHMAIKHPALVASLTLDSGQAGSAESKAMLRVLSVLKRMLALVPTALYQRLMLRQFHGYTGAARSALAADIQRVGKRGFLLHVQAHAFHNVGAALTTIKVPTLILAGANDRLTRSGAAALLHERIAHSTLIVVPDAGHGVLISQPLRAYNQIIHFLQAQQ